MSVPPDPATDRLVATASQTVGPFFHFGPGDHPQLGSLITPGTRGERIRLTIRVFDGDRVPVPDALVEIWQADGEGRFPLPSPGAPRDDAFGGFGRLPTGADGSCTFETVRPRPIVGGDLSHVNVCLFMRGLLRHLYTRLYFADVTDLISDHVLGMVPAGRKGTLCAHRDREAQDHWIFEIYLQGEQETVFFDL